FTLIEVVIALAIVAITTTIAVASYRGHVVRSHRAEAVQALLAAAAEQEKFHLSHGHYGDRLDADVGDEPPGLPVASRTPGGHYALTVKTASASEFLVVAAATSDRADPSCQSLSIDESGRREAADASGSDSVRRCW
ncbi:MAG: type IV pilin protein, partial [Steroidobacteraceae bacterium]